MADETNRNIIPATVLVILFIALALSSIQSCNELRAINNALTDIKAELSTGALR